MKPKPTRARDAFPTEFRFGSVCSGIEAASVAWEPIGWKAAWLSEIEPFPSAVLAHHYPDVPNLGDMTQLPDRIASGEVEAPDLFCGGTPCQAFSVAGLRKSLDDARGNLSLVFCEIANAIDSARAELAKPPAIVLWENVPGVLSTKDNAFGCFLAELAGEDDPIKPLRGKWTNAGVILGPQRAVAWRILDAQYFGVAQRRRRVFVVASARDDFDPAAVLFEFDGLRRDSAPSRQARKEVTECAGTRTANGGCLHRPAGNANELDFCVTAHAPEIARCIATREGSSQDFETTTMVAQPIGFNARQDPDAWQGRTGPLDTNGGTQAVAFQQTADCLTAAYGTKWNGNASSTNGSLFASQAMAARRLTPVECERLQGFPDNYTAIPWKTAQEARRKGISYETLLAQRGMTLRGPSLEDCPDGPRYKALGNSWAVPVVRWIGQRIAFSAAISATPQPTNLKEIPR
jgi:DNA (cytosine-5)-methyltransferase 1